MVGGLEDYLGSRRLGRRRLEAIGLPFALYYPHHAPYDRIYVFFGVFGGLGKGVVLVEFIWCYGSGVYAKTISCQIV